MPLLNVSFVLDHPLFNTTFQLIRRAETVGADGRSTTVETLSTVSGVVTQGDGNRLSRTEDGRRIEGAIMVHSREPLSSGTETTDADEIVYQGVRYVVAVLGDYSDYGEGFYMAVCTLKPINP